MILSPERVSFDRITDFVYVGSRIASLDDYHRLRAQGVRACVDMKHEGADPWTFEAFLWLPTVDHDPPSQVHFQMGVAFLRQCERARMPAFVHCMAGVGRSSALVLAHLLAGPFRERGTRPALDFLCARRPVANPNPEQVEAAERAARSFVG
ncbi:MAG: dual specificity protein phosphatase family protein [Acidobacteria bacterium]|nr:dual specificity protein phosphatase family protein [Acidobacteriota bacterium]